LKGYFWVSQFATPILRITALHVDKIRVLKSDEMLCKVL
jgi:hypothetical protein